jgi:anthranilate phosphoribosyltransferase
MIKKAIAKVVERENLTEAEMIEVMNQIMSGEATPAQVAAFVTALRMKGETVEKSPAPHGSCDRATRIRLACSGPDRDDINWISIHSRHTGTGGSGTNTFNVSPQSPSWCPPAGEGRQTSTAPRLPAAAAQINWKPRGELDITPEFSKCIAGSASASLLQAKAKFAAGPRRSRITHIQYLGPLTSPRSRLPGARGIPRDPHCAMC